MRCFRYDNPEHKVRYPAIASHLSQNRLPYMVSFHYMARGIRVGPNWYPILKMKWIEGDSLASFIEKNLSSQTALQKLAGAWSRMLDDLRRARIAHGDLQHGNVLVVQGDLKLVDYDGMYVPELDGSCALELGHRNYQHPERTELDFGPHLDSFSAWLVYASLIALAARPGLWQQLTAGDECLLFRKEDLAAPEHSAAFRVLKAMPDERVRHLAEQIEHFLWIPLSQIPPLTDGDIVEHQIVHPPSGPDGGWINDYTTKPLEIPAADFPPFTAGKSVWIHDHVDLRFNASFTNSVRVDRLTSLAVISATALLCHWLTLGHAGAAAPFGWIVPIGTAVCVIFTFWRFRYSQDAVFVQIRAVRSEFSQAQRDADSPRNDLEGLKTKRQRRRDSYFAESSRLR